MLTNSSRKKHRTFFFLLFNVEKNLCLVWLCSWKKAWIKKTRLMMALWYEDWISSFVNFLIVLFCEVCKIAMNWFNEIFKLRRHILMVWKTLGKLARNLFEHLNYYLSDDVCPSASVCLSVCVCELFNGCP